MRNNLGVVLNVQLPFNTVEDNDRFLENLRLSGIVSSDLNIIPSNELNVFITESNDLYNTINESQPDEFPNVINSQYYDNHSFNQIKPDSSSTLGILHTNLASINKYHDDLSTVLTLLKPEIHVIGISEHEIHSNDTTNTTNINLEGYHPCVFDPTEISHGETGFYLKDSLVFKRRDGLKFNLTSAQKATFIEIIFPNKKNIIVGCIYRHPNSIVTVNCFIDNYIRAFSSGSEKFCSVYTLTSKYQLKAISSHLRLINFKINVFIQGPY